MKQILVVDDSLVNRMYITKLLGDEHEILCASSGKEMFDILEQAEPHLILLDIIMPELDGFQIIEKLKASDEYRTIPVIFITGLGDDESEEKGLNLGAIDYISKPFKDSIIKARVNAYVKLHEFVKQTEIAGQRDGLTGLYNKKTTELLIKKFLKGNSFKNGALMIIDVDFFKTINDTFGHLYGDAVLSQLSDALKSVFQKSDIIGRVGGDEFFVFLKNYKSKEVLEERAKAVCEKFKKTYKQKDQTVNISASIGIATTEDVTDFEVIYENADVALYNTKADGKNGYTFFTGEEKSQYKSTRTEIEDKGVGKNLKSNFREYIFSLLYTTKDLENSVHSVLHLTCEQYNFCNAHVLKIDYEDHRMSHLFNWSKNKDFEIPEDKTASLQEVMGIHQLFSNEDFAIEQNKDKNTIRYMYAIKYGTLLYGYICFEQNIADSQNFKESAHSTLIETCKTMSVFLLNSFLAQSTLDQKIHSMAVLESLDLPIYVINKETFKPYYMNSSARDKIVNTRGLTCHKKFYNKDTQCEYCPLINDENSSIMCKEITWNSDNKAFVVSGLV